MRIKLVPDERGPQEETAAAGAPGSRDGFHGINFLHRLKDERRRPGDCTVILYQSAYRDIVEHLGRDTTREHGGLLLGYEGPRTATDEMTVYVSKVLLAQHTFGTKSRLVLTEDTWAEFANQTESLAGTNLRRVGWYHSHPSFGIFLSPYDLDVCSNFQRQTHLALVYDPVSHEGGMFIKGAAGYDPNGPQGFWEYCDITPNSIVDWKNVESVPAGLVPPGEGGAAGRGGMGGGAAITDPGDGKPEPSGLSSLAGAVGGRRPEVTDAWHGRPESRARLMTFLRGLLLGVALAALTIAIGLYVSGGRVITDRQMNEVVAGLQERNKQLSEEVEKARSNLQSQSALGVTTQDVAANSNAGSEESSNDRDNNAGGNSSQAKRTGGAAARRGARERGGGPRFPKKKKKPVPVDGQSPPEPAGAAARQGSAAGAVDSTPVMNGDKAAKKTKKGNPPQPANTPDNHH
jgi:proteasome lid subunit RPN8/RPN11